MSQTRSEALEKLYSTYSQWYNIEHMDASEAPLVASAVFHEHGTGYILVKKAEMWSADRHEYTYFFDVPHLTKEICSECIERARTLGEANIDLSGHHMSTYIVAVFVCDTADEAAVTAAKKCHIVKSFQFSLKGWMEVHTAVIELGKDSITGNGAGRNTAKFLKNVLYPKARHRFLKR